MSSSHTYTLATSGAGMVLSTDSASRPKDPPTGLIATRAVQTKAGWVGQVIVDQEIVWESPVVTENPDVTSDDSLGHLAVGLANDRVVTAVKALFAAD